MDMDDCKLMIKRHEGLSLLPYEDTVGMISIGYGRNLSQNGLTIQEAEQLFEHDFNIALKELLNFDWFALQPNIVKAGLVNMSFNMGLTRLLKFKKMIAALEHKDYRKAAAEALNSKWAKQVKGRAIEISYLIRTGE